MMVYGPHHPSSVSLSHLPTSMTDIYKLMDGSLSEAPTTFLPVYVDVRDVAEAHRLAYETIEPGRFAVSGGNFTKGEVCKLLRNANLGLEDRVPSKGLDAEDDLESYTVDTSKAEEVLGLKFRSFEDTMLDMAKAFLALEKRRSSDVVTCSRTFHSSHDSTFNCFFAPFFCWGSAKAPPGRRFLNAFANSPNPPVLSRGTSPRGLLCCCRGGCNGVAFASALGGSSVPLSKPVSVAGDLSVD